MAASTATTVRDLEVANDRQPRHSGAGRASAKSENLASLA